MFRRIIKLNIRRPLYSLAVILFAAVLTVVLCYLHRSAQEEQRSFEQTYASIPVVFRVTALDGGKTSTVHSWVAELFTPEGMHPNLSPYVGRLHLRVGRKGTYTYTAASAGDQPATETGSASFIGITSCYVAEELTENWGGRVFWNEGYDESILTTEELVCLVPEQLKDLQEISATFTYKYSVNNLQYVKTATRTFQVVGYHISDGGSSIYCPYAVMKYVYGELGVKMWITEVCATLNDNFALPQLRQAAADWFAEPNPMGEKTPWGRFNYDYYLYALDIDDYMLQSLESNMKNSMRLNALASAVVFILSAGAGFLTGFLVIRSRKREIALMRTMGSSHPAIFIELAVEQLMCVAAGIVIGGGYSLWQPVGKLCLFGGIYFLGLSAALLVFLRKNLLTTIKEEE